MGCNIAGRSLAVPVIVALFGGALVGGTLLSPAAADVARAQTELPTAANGVLLPPLDYDPVAARNEDLAPSAVAPATPTPVADPADASAGTAAPETITDAPVSGSSVTTSLGGSDVIVSSVGGSHEVDGPGNRSRRNR
jgi:hypothetical protein